MAAKMEGPRFSFAPDRCTVWTTFAELQVGDRIDYQGPSMEVAYWENFPTSGLVQLTLETGARLLLPPETGTYREPREDELEPPGAFCSCANPECPSPDGEYTH